MTDNSFITVTPGEQDQRKQNEVLRQIMDGKTNNRGTFTLTANQATTDVVDYRSGTDSVVLWMPTTANAAAEDGAGTMYVSTRGKQTFTVTHANNAQTDRTFAYVVIG